MLAHIAFTALLAPTAAAAPLDAPLETRQTTTTTRTYIHAGLGCGKDIKWDVATYRPPPNSNSPPTPNGQPVQVTVVARNYFGQWQVAPGGKGQIKIELRNNVTKCIDAGSNPANGIELKLWDCYDVPQQQWQIHDDKIQLVGTNLCWDVRDGQLEPPMNLFGVLQTWQCYDGNPNQMFYTETITF